MERPQIGQGRARSKRKKPDPINQVISQPSNLSQEIPGRTKIEARKTNTVHTTNNANDRIVNNNPFMPDVLFHLDPLLTPPKQSIKQNMTHNQNSQKGADINPNINFDFEENSPFQEGIMSKTFQRPDKSFFQEPKELGDLINKGNFVHKYLPKQTENKINSPSSKSAIRKLETLAEKYVLLDLLLFRISSEKETVVLAIPEACADRIITLHHKSLFAGHQGVIKTYLTISDKFFIPNLIHYLRSYTKGCHLCQLSCNEKLPPRQLQTRINPNYMPMSRLSMDLKVMPRFTRT